MAAPVLTAPAMTMMPSKICRSLGMKARWLIVPEWPSEKLAPVVGHFFEAVNYYEMARDVDELRGLS